MLFEDALSKEHCKLTKLTLSKCSLTDCCIPSLCKALQDERCQLTDLSLGYNAIGDKGACMLFKDALTKEHCKLTELNLGKCSLTDQCIPSLCKALQDECRQLTVLSLGNNAIGYEGACMLFKDALTKEHCQIFVPQERLWKQPFWSGKTS
jgi:Ran GTPase-activating protein (RanGAP) involved in mRNA processing and transport